MYLFHKIFNSNYYDFHAKYKYLFILLKLFDLLNHYSLFLFCLIVVTNLNQYFFYKIWIFKINYLYCWHLYFHFSFYFKLSLFYLLFFRQLIFILYSYLHFYCFLKLFVILALIFFSKPFYFILFILIYSNLASKTELQFV